MKVLERRFLRSLSDFRLFSYLQYRQSRQCSSKPNLMKVDLYGRDIVSPDQLSRGDLRTLLWTALDLKAQKRPLDLLASRHVSLVLVKPCARYQVAFERAARDLGASLTTHVHPEWGQQPDMADSGRLLSSLTDAVVYSGLGQLDLESLADGCRVPVLNCSSDLFSMVKALADFMTLLETVGPLRRMCLAWVGPPTPLCNAYLCLAPKLGLSLRVFCICPEGNGQMSAVSLARGYALCRGQAELHECSSAAEAVYRADIVATANHDVPQHRLTLKIVEEAALDWFFLHALPRTDVEVTDDVFKHKNNLTWKSVENTRYVAMALLLRVLEKYEPLSPEPDFDGPP